MKRLLIALLLILSAVPAHALDATSAVGRMLLWPHGGAVNYVLNAPFTSSGIGTNSYDFNGSSHYVSVADDDAFSPSAMSVWAWVNPDTIVGVDGIAYKNNNTAFEWQLDLTSGAPRMILYHAGGSSFVGRTAPAIATGQWTFLMGIVRTTTGAVVGDIDILQNCVAVDNADTTSIGAATISNTAAIVAIGSRSDGANYFDGKLMNVGFANADMTSLCESIMSASNYASYSGSKTNLVSWWDLQSDVVDKHGAKNGTAQGGVAPASPSAYPFKDSSNPVLLANGQVLDQDPALWGMTKGTLNVVDTSTGTVSLTGTTLSIVGSGSGIQTGVYGAGVARALGQTYFITSPNNGFTGQLGWNSSAAITQASMVNSMRFTTGTDLNAFDGTTPSVIGSITGAGTSYKYAFVLGGADSNGVPFKTGDTSSSYLYGSLLFANGGTQYPNWTLLYKQTNNNTVTMYPAIQQAGGTQAHDNIKIPTSPISSSIFQPYALDTFTGTNGDNLVSGHTMDVGSGWTSRVGDSVWRIDTNTGELGTAGTNPAVDANTRYLVANTVADGIFSLKVKCDTTSPFFNGIVFRNSADTTNGTNEFWYLLRGDGTNCDEYLQRNVDGRATNLYSNASGTMTNGTYYVLTVQAIGNTIRIYRDGVKIGSDITDSFNATAVRSGIGANSVAIIYKAFDNFSVHGATTNGNGTSYNSFFTKYGY